MQRLNVESCRGDYSVVAQPGVLSDLRGMLSAEGAGLPRSVVSNTTVAPLWAKAAARSVEAPLIELVR